MLENNRNLAPGFTLIELIVVITIIGILGTLVVMNTTNSIAEANWMKIQHDTKAIVTSAEAIYARTGHWPQSIREMLGRREVVSFRETPFDPWKREYIYEIVDDQAYVTCLGRDGEEGGEGQDRDYRYPEDNFD